MAENQNIEYKGNTAQFGSNANDVFFTIFFLRKARFTSSKPSAFAIESATKSIRYRAISFVRYS